MRKLAPWKVRLLWKSYLSGAAAPFAATQAGVNEQTAYRYYPDWDRGLTPEFAVLGIVVAELPPKMREAYRKEARRRNMPLRSLVVEIAKVMANDNLFDAVLGVPHDITKPTVYYHKRRTSESV